MAADLDDQAGRRDPVRLVPQHPGLVAGQPAADPVGDREGGLEVRWFGGRGYGRHRRRLLPVARSAVRAAPAGCVRPTARGCLMLAMPALRTPARRGPALVAGLHRRRPAAVRLRQLLHRVERPAEVGAGHRQQRQDDQLRRAVHRRDRRRQVHDQAAGAVERHAAAVLARLPVRRTRAARTSARCRPTPRSAPPTPTAPARTRSAPSCCPRGTRWPARPTSPTAGRSATG